MLPIAHKAAPPCSGVDHPPDQNRLTGDVFHGDAIAADGLEAGPGISVHKDRGLLQRADPIQIGFVKELDRQKSGHLLQMQVGRQRLGANSGFVDIK